MRSVFRYRLVRPAIVLLAFVCLTAACSSGGDEPPSTSEAAPTSEPESSDFGGVQIDLDKDLVIGVSIRNLEQSFYQGIESGIRQRAEELGVDVVIIGAGDDSDKQAVTFADLISQGVDGILLTPVDSAAAVDMATRAEASGVPVLAVANQIGSVEEFGDQHIYAGTVGFVTADDVDMGRQAANIVADEVGDGDVAIGILEGSPEDSRTTLRNSGFEEQLAERGVDYEIAATVNGNWNAADGAEACTRLLGAAPTIDVLFSMSDEMTSGCLGELPEFQLANTDIVSIGGTATGLELLVENKIVGTVCEKPATMGALALESLIIAIRTGQLDQGLLFYQTPKATVADADVCNPQW